VILLIRAWQSTQSEEGVGDDEKSRTRKARDRSIMFKRKKEARRYIEASRETAPACQVKRVMKAQNGTSSIDVLFYESHHTPERQRAQEQGVGAGAGKGGRGWGRWGGGGGVGKGVGR